MKKHVWLVQFSKVLVQGIGEDFSWCSSQKGGFQDEGDQPSVLRHQQNTRKYNLFN